MDALLGEIDIRFDFQKNNLLQIHVNVPMDNEKSIEKARWEITPNGAIRIMNIENGHVKINNSDEWILDDGKLFPKSEKGKSDKNVYLVKLKGN